MNANFAKLKYKFWSMCFGLYYVVKRRWSCRFSFSASTSGCKGFGGTEGAKDFPNPKNNTSCREKTGKATEPGYNPITTICSRSQKQTRLHGNSSNKDHKSILYVHVCFPLIQTSLSWCRSSLIRSVIVQRTSQPSIVHYWSTRRFDASAQRLLSDVPLNAASLWVHWHKQMIVSVCFFSRTMTRLRMDLWRWQTKEVLLYVQWIDRVE